MDDHGMPKLRYGVKEIRVGGEPFPLYPGEVLVGNIKHVCSCKSANIL